MIVTSQWKGRSAGVRLWAVLWGICLSCQGSGVAAQAEYVIQNWQTADGLPENTVRGIVETPDGYLWVGTANGLARFDGVGFRIFDPANTPALLSANIFALVADAQAGVWISTRRGVFRYHGGIFSAMPRPGDEVKGPISNLVADSSGTLWMRAGSTLARWTGDRIEAAPMPEGPDGVAQFYAAADGGFWFAASNGLWRVREGRNSRVVAGPAPGLVAAGRDGRVWGIVDDARLVRLAGAGWEPVTDLPERCRTLWVAANGDVWMGAAATDRAYRWRAGRRTEIGPGQGLQGNRAIVFAEDREGNVWLGMNGAGLYRLREKRLRVFGQEAGFGNTALSSVVEDERGEVVVGCMGWNFYKQAGQRFEPLAPEEPVETLRYATALAPAAAGGVWAGTFYGPLSRVSGNRIVETVGAPAGTRCLMVDRDGGLWRGTLTAGLEHFSGAGVACYAVTNGLSYDNVYCLAQDGSGAIWAGTERGLNRIAQGSITRFGRTNGLGHDFVTALCVDSQGTLWAGSLGGGLSGWNGTRFVTITARDGLADNTVQQLVEDGLGHLWIGTRVGLVRVPIVGLHDFLRGGARVIHGTLIGRNEGLERPNCWTEYQPASARGRDGRLWFCTGSGLALIDPRHFETPVPPPLVHLEEATLDGEPPREILMSNAGLVVPPRNQRLQIRYTGISPSAPELLRFRYRLRGFEPDWVEAGAERVASYTHVPAGRYEFEVTAVNNHGAWSKAASVPVTFQPAFWETPWFRALAAAAFLASGPWFYFWRVRQLERRRQRQEEFSRKLIESQEAERRRIAAELHDGLGQNLALMKNLASLSAASHASTSPAADEIATAATRALEEVHAISYALRPPELDRLGLAKALAGMVRRAGEASGIKFETRIEIDGPLPADSDIHLFRIAQEAVNNLIKHSGAKTSRLELWSDESGTHLVVADDGCGLPLEKLDSGSKRIGLGLSGIEERARLIGARCHWISTPGHGTTLSVLIPPALIPRPQTI